jgi:hypothetical protein
MYPLTVSPFVPLNKPFGIPLVVSYAPRGELGTRKSLGGLDALCKVPDRLRSFSTVQVRSEEASSPNFLAVFFLFMG